MARDDIRIEKVGMKLSTRKTNKAFAKKIRKMEARGYDLIDNSRVGGAGGNLIFRKRG